MHELWGQIDPATILSSGHFIFSQSVIQLTVIEALLCARNCAICWDIMISRTDYIICGVCSNKKKCRAPCSKIIKIQHGDIRVLKQAWGPSVHGALLCMGPCATALHEAGSHEKP